MIIDTNPSCLTYTRVYKTATNLTIHKLDNEFCESVDQSNIAVTHNIYK